MQCSLTLKDVQDTTWVKTRMVSPNLLECMVACTVWICRNCSHSSMVRVEGSLVVEDMDIHMVSVDFRQACAVYI